MHKRKPTKGHQDRTSPQRIVRTTLEAEALRLRRDGHTFSEIAEMLGMTEGNAEQKVSTLITSALARKGKPEADQLRSSMLDQLDILMNRAIRIARADGPDRVAAINAATNVANRMSALIGADAPKQVDLKDERQLPPDAAARKKFLERLAQEAEPEEPAGG